MPEKRYGGLNLTLVQNLKRKVDELRESEAKFRTLFESSADAIMTLAPPDWKFTSGNPATVKMFRAKDEAEFISKGPWELSPEVQPDGKLSSQKAKEMIGKAMEKGSNFFEWTHKRLDGEEFPATVLLTRMEVAGRSLLQATVRDITELKSAEKVLKESEERFRLLFENMLDGYAYCEMVFDRHGRPVDFVYLNVNRSFGQLTGLKDVLGKRVTEVIPGIKKAHPELFKIYGRVALTGKPEKFDINLESLGMTLSIAVYGAGKGRFVAVFDNITERKAAEECLRLNEERYRSLVNGIKDIIISFSPDGIVQFVGENVSAIGYKPGEVIGRSIVKFVHPGDVNKVKADLEKSVAGGKVVPTVFRLKKKDGSYVKVEDMSVPVKVKGKVVLFNGSVRILKAGGR